MRVVPAVLDRTILAGLLLLPLVGVLASVALAGRAGLLVAGVVAGGAVLYAGVTWFAGARVELARRLADMEVAPEDARIEALGRTAGRNLLKTLPLYAVAVLATFVDALVAVLAVGAGLGLVAVLTAVVINRAEAAGGGRIVRDGEGALRRF